MDTIRLDLASLLSRGPLLRQDALRPGDVLLVKGNTRSSSFIAKTKKGEYSHAAIWMPGGDERVESLLLTESDTGGVGFTFLMPMTLYAGKFPEANPFLKFRVTPKNGFCYDTLSAKTLTWHGCVRLQLICRRIISTKPILPIQGFLKLLP